MVSKVSKHDVETPDSHLGFTNKPASRDSRAVQRRPTEPAVVAVALAFWRFLRAFLIILLALPLIIGFLFSKSLLALWALVGRPLFTLVRRLYVEPMQKMILLYVYSTKIGRCHVCCERRRGGMPKQHSHFTRVRVGACSVYPVPCLEANYSYLIVKDACRSSESVFAVLIDPCDAETTLDALRIIGATHYYEARVELKAIFATHKHWDHVAGVLELLSCFPDVHVYSHREEAIAGTTHCVRGGDVLEPVHGLRLEVIETPCHTSGHVVYVLEQPPGACVPPGTPPATRQVSPYSAMASPLSVSAAEAAAATAAQRGLSPMVMHELSSAVDFTPALRPRLQGGVAAARSVAGPPQACLFSGDTLFLGSSGAPFEGTPEDMLRSLARIFRRCGGDTLVFPGHEYTEANLKSSLTHESPYESPHDFLGLAGLWWRAAHRRYWHRGLPTVPGRLGDELFANPAVRHLCQLAKRVEAVAEEEMPAQKGPVYVSRFGQDEASPYDFDVLPLHCASPFVTFWRKDYDRHLEQLCRCGRRGFDAVRELTEAVQNFQAWEEPWVRGGAGMARKMPTKADLAEAFKVLAVEAGSGRPDTECRAQLLLDSLAGLGKPPSPAAQAALQAAFGPGPCNAQVMASQMLKVRPQPPETWCGYGVASCRACGLACKQDTSCSEAQLAAARDPNVARMAMLTSPPITPRSGVASDCAGAVGCSQVDVEVTPAVHMSPGSFGMRQTDSFGTTPTAASTPDSPVVMRVSHKDADESSVLQVVTRSVGTCFLGVDGLGAPSRLSSTSPRSSVDSLSYTARRRATSASSMTRDEAPWSSPVKKVDSA